MKEINQIVALLLATVATACNLYDASDPTQTYLCGGQTCDMEGDTSLQC